MLFRQKYLSLFIIVMMFFVIASGGCGGGSSSSNIPNDNDNPNQENPDNPNNPNNPTPNNPETKYDFSILEGTWKASNCTGTARSGDLTAEMSLSTTHDTITFTDVIVNGSTGTFEGTSDIILTIEGYTEWEDEFGGYKPYDIGGYEYQNISGNLRVLLLNNGRGGIFNLLKGLEQSPARDRFVAAEHSTQAEGICHQNSIYYQQATSMEELRQGIDLLLSEDFSSPMVLEVMTNAADDEQAFRQYYQNLII